MNHQISNASQEQSDGIRQISEAMNQIDAATQKNASGAQEVALVSKEVLDQSQELHNLVVELNEKFLGQKDEAQTHNNVVQMPVRPTHQPKDDFFQENKARKVSQLDQF